MKLSWAMLADAAQAKDGLAYIIGGGIDTIYAEQVPVAIHLSLIARFAYRPAEAGKHTVHFVLIDDDGQQLHRIEGELGVEGNAEVPTSWDHGAIFAFTIAGMPLPKFGIYRIDILVDGRAEGDLNLRIIKPPRPSRAQRRGKTAELGPAPSTGEALDRLIAEGRVARPKRHGLPAPLQMDGDPHALSRALDEIRHEH